MKTIAITIPFGMSARNILRSDILKLLSEQMRVVILSPFAEDPRFHQEFGRKNVFFERLKFQSGLGGKVVRRLLDPVETYWFTERTKIETLVIYRDWLKKERPLRYWKVWFLAQAFGHEPWILWLRRLHLYFLWARYYQDIFSKYAVDLVFVTHLYNLADQQVAVCAKRLGIPVIGMPHSWDNLTSKSGVRQGTNPQPGRTIPLHFDRVIAWNQVLAQELKDFYGYREEEIFVSGVPQFDIYTRKENFLSREAFFKSIGADLKKELILYAAGTPQYVSPQDRIIETLVAIIRSGRLGAQSQLLVRHHPNRMAIESLKNIEKKYKGSSDVFFEKPSSAFTAKEDIAWDSSQGREYELANTILASDVVVTMASTITLDAVALDRPVIIIATKHNTEPYFQSLGFCLELTHYKKIVGTNAFTIARDAKELEEQLDVYLRNPRFSAVQRKALVDLECGPLDGGAGQRIADFMISFINSQKTSRIHAASLK